MPSFHPLLVVLPLVLVACEAEPGSDDTSGDTQEETNGDTLPPYRYVRIDDEGPLDEDGSSPGADIDAIELQQASSEPASYAVSVAASNVDSTLREQDEDYILGAPDDAFFSLGGKGRWIVVSLGDELELEVDDLLTVYEDSTGETDERVALSVSVGTAADGEWVHVGSYDGSGSQAHAIVMTVPELPEGQGR